MKLGFFGVGFVLFCFDAKRTWAPEQTTCAWPQWAADHTHTLTPPHPPADLLPQTCSKAGADSRGLMGTGSPD